jgi:hypothetical protein
MTKPNDLKPDWESILGEAHTAAMLAQADLKENPFAFDCGFAWVSLPGNHPLVRYCRDKTKGDDRGDNRRKYGRKGYPTGWDWWCPGGAMVQSVSIHEVGARAFRDSLAKHGISANVSSRLD